MSLGLLSRFGMTRAAGGGGGGGLFTSRASSSAINGAQSTSITIDKPTGTLEGDLMTAVVGADANAFGAWTMPSGWSLALEYRANNMLFSIMYKIAAASEASTYTFTIPFGTQGRNAGAIFSWAPNGGLAWSSPLDASASNYVASGTSFPAPVVTVGANDSLVVHGWFCTDAFGSGAEWTPPASLLASEAVGNADAGLCGGGLSQATAGSSVAAAATTSTTKSAVACITVSFAPPA